MGLCGLRQQEFSHVPCGTIFLMEINVSHRLRISHEYSTDLDSFSFELDGPADGYFEQRRLCKFFHKT